MASALVEKFRAELLRVDRGAKLEVMLLANDKLREITRVKTGQNRAEAVLGWGPGRNGNGFSAPGGHGEPGDEAAHRAAAESELGEDVSIRVDNPHAFWMDEEHDGTMLEVAEAIE